MRFIVNIELSNKRIIFFTGTTIRGSTRRTHQRLKSNRKQTVALCVYIPGRAVPLHDDLLTQDPPEPGPATINAPGEQSVGAERGGVSYWEKSPSVCVLVFSLRL